MKLVALAILWCLAPGSMEATENLAHLLGNGHLAHATEHEDSHPEPGPEHGCNATLHLCSCHGTPVGLIESPTLLPAHETSGSVRTDVVRRCPTAHLQRVERPPQS